MSDDPKTAAQLGLTVQAAMCPIGVYSHRNGGTYAVYAHSVDEETLEPLVHYWSFDKKTSWTRKISVFTEQVDGKPRFERERDLTAIEMLVVVNYLVGALVAKI
jgi:hypothetical protein